MPRKIRELKADLRRAGFTEKRKRGKGSHSAWKHPAVRGTLFLSGQDGDDADHYQEEDVRKTLAQRAHGGGD